MTRIERIEAGLTLLCKVAPPAGLVALYMNGLDDDDELQQFAIDHSPKWVQGIAFIDAAILMAELPPEGGWKP